MLTTLTRKPLLPSSKTLITTTVWSTLLPKLLNWSNSSRFLLSSRRTPRSSLRSLLTTRTLLLPSKLTMLRLSTAFLCKWPRKLVLNLTKLSSEVSSRLLKISLTTKRKVLHNKPLLKANVLRNMTIKSNKSTTISPLLPKKSSDSRVKLLNSAMKSMSPTPTSLNGQLNSRTLRPLSSLFKTNSPLTRPLSTMKLPACKYINFSFLNF